MITTPWSRLADRLDPPKAADRPELRDPVTLAAHCDPAFQVRAHNRLIGDEMRQLRERWLAGARAPRLQLNTPPQIGKSTTAVEWGAFWWMILEPTTSIVIGCYGDDLANDRGGGVRRLVERYGAQFNMHLRRGSAGLKDWSTTSGASVRSVGIGSGITGHDADLMFIDDPIRSRADADSLRKREQTYRWYTADMLTRLAPRAPMVMIQTPWDPDDLRGRVLSHEGDARRGGTWRVVVIPAFARTGEPTDKDSAETIEDPLGRAHGDPVPHPKIAEADQAGLMAHWLDVRARQDTRTWQSLYQCDPKPQEGTLLSWNLLRERRWYEPGRGGCAERRTVAVAIDPSGGGRDTAGIIGGYLGVDGRVHITHDLSAPMSSADWSRKACELAADTDADRFIIETNFGADQATLILRTAWKMLREEDPERFSEFVPRIVTVRAKRGKLLRAEPIAQQWKEGMVGTAAYLPDLESEWATWIDGGDSPGRIDASVYLTYSLLPVPQSGASDTAAGSMLAATQLVSWGN